MTLRAILASIVIAGSVFAVNAEKAKTTRSMHSKIHQEQLANVKKSGMDATVIGKMLKEDIDKRESAVLDKMSSESSKMIDDLLKEANKHIGKPYRSGMKGPKAFDCSGFSSYVYRQFGYSLSPCSRTQYTEGVKVDRKSLRKGDLVFFTSRSSGKNVGHVGIVVSADNATVKFRFIHASIKGVKIDECQGYYEGRYIGARRIIND